MANTHGSRRFAAASISLLLLTPVAALAATSPVSAEPGTGTTVDASDFGYFMYPLAKANAGACTGLAEDVTSEPFYSNSDCGYSTFTLTGGTPKTVEARLFAEGSETPFVTKPATAFSSGYRVELEPPADWPSGLVRMEVVADGEPAGESTFGLDMLGATLSAEGTFEAGQDIPVTGTVSKLDSGPVTDDGEGVPGTFTLEVRSPEGRKLHSRTVTAGDDGTFSVTVPGEATRDVRAGRSTGYRTALGLRAVDATYKDPETTDTWSAGDAGAGSATVLSPPTTLQLENSFVSSVGWVKPGETYPSRIFVENPTDRAYDTVTVTVPAPAGTTFTQARAGAGAGTATIESGEVTWDLGTVPAAGEAGPTRRSLVLEARAHTLAKDPEVVWKNLSSTATLSIDDAPEQATATSHGPRVIPPAEQFDTARYGDRPFPVVPVDYRDRKHQADSSGDELSDVINSPWVEGSTFNLFQEISLGQLFPHATVPSAGIGSADFTYEPGFDFSALDPQGTCTGVTVGADGAGTPLYGERIKDGFYQLPGDTAYYGADRYGSALAGAVAGVGALMDIDSACGPTGKLVYDAAAIADPEIDYSDYDTDKDGVVDFFMVVFAGCGGHGASQLSVAACPYADAPYDNVWPHSSSLEFYYTDEETGLPGYVTDDQLKDLEGRPLFYADSSRTEMSTNKTDFPVKVRVGPYNVNPETAIDKASVISHEYGHSLGLPDFYSLGSRETYGDWNLMATDKSQNMDVFSRQELGWVVPEVLEPGRTKVDGWTDSKEDTHSITWQRPDGSSYVLQGPDVHNSEAYVAKLPGRQLIDPAKFETADKASATHAWWSGSGNDFGCAPEGGHNLDVVVPGLSELPEGSTVKLEMKSLWDIEWDYDYGFVLTSTDGGETYASQASEKEFTTATSNPNQNACQGKYGNGLTGSSGSYAAGSAETDRLLGESPKSVFLADSYDISELAGKDSPVIRFSYATDPGLARPGWFVDDLKVTATTPSGDKILLATDLEDDGGPDDPRFFSGGCKEDLRVAKRCTKGWTHVDSSSEAPADHAYYMELRDRSGFDLDSNGENDRDPIEFEPGLSLVYTDEAHG
ncbi:MAG: immune inhibitor A domain-containing protein, partial [Nocardioidaceae bacterium]